MATVFVWAVCGEMSYMFRFTEIVIGQNLDKFKVYCHMEADVITINYYVF